MQVKKTLRRLRLLTAMLKAVERVSDLSVDSTSCTSCASSPDLAKACLKEVGAVRRRLKRLVKESEAEEPLPPK